METTKTVPLAGVEPAQPAERDSPRVTALIERAKEGDAAAFGDLMRLYERRVISLAMQLGLSRNDALDACQETFIKVFRYIRRFESGRSFFTWLHRIAIHASFDQMRRQHRRGSVSLEELTPEQMGRLGEQGPSLEIRVESADMTGKLLAGLNLLSRRERVVFTLRDLQGLGTGEIGSILRLRQVTVRRHCATARRKLRERLFPGDH